MARDNRAARLAQQDTRRHRSNEEATIEANLRSRGGHKAVDSTQLTLFKALEVAGLALLLCGPGAAATVAPTRSGSGTTHRSKGHAPKADACIAPEDVYGGCLKYDEITSTPFGKSVEEFFSQYNLEMPDKKVCILVDKDQQKRFDAAPPFVPILDSLSAFGTYLDTAPDAIDPKDTVQYAKLQEFDDCVDKSGTHKQRLEQERARQAVYNIISSSQVGSR